LFTQQPHVQVGLQAAEADDGDLLHHPDVRWLSCGNALKRVCALSHEIVSFVSERCSVMDRCKQGLSNVP